MLVRDGIVMALVVDGVDVVYVVDVVDVFDVAVDVVYMLNVWMKEF